MKRTYLTRPNSYIMDVFLNGTGIDRKEAAEVLGVSYQYFCNKLNRDSFSAEDFFRISNHYLVKYKNDHEVEVIISIYDRAKELKNGLK